LHTFRFFIAHLARSRFLLLGRAKSIFSCSAHFAVYFAPRHYFDRVVQTASAAPGIANRARQKHVEKSAASGGWINERQEVRTSGKRDLRADEA
jgi:hypothetical protein